MIVTQEILRAICHYDPITGIFKRVMKMSNKSRKLFPCCSIPTAKSRGYLQMGIGGKIYYVHRLIHMYLYGSFPCGEIDHTDGNRTNNRLDNLRVVEHKINSRNVKVGSTNKSGFLGVSNESIYGTYRAYISKDGVRTHIGSFKTKSEAIKARKNYELSFDFHANHGRTQ
jgi:HNH endonuclease